MPLGLLVNRPITKFNWEIIRKVLSGSISHYLTKKLNTIDG